MITLEELQKGIAALEPATLARFRDWFAAFDDDRFDRTIAADAESGRLDELASEALKDVRRRSARSV
ncbi:MAG: hypothetical protein KIS68_13180 [Bauldia sp.]|nr:hypothetical protein [Bauldia sp.]